MPVNGGRSSPPSIRNRFAPASPRSPDRADQRPPVNPGRGYAAEPAAGKRRQRAVAAAPKYEGQRAWQKRGRHPKGAIVETHESLRPGQLSYMDNHRVEPRPAFGREDPGDGALVCRITAEP